MKRLKIDPSVQFIYGKGIRQLPIEIVDDENNPLADFDLMCMAIDNDIESAEGSGAQFINGIRRIESGEDDYIEADGNAWVTYITRGKVWFEGLYNQGEGGEVSFGQYKFAVTTYVHFLLNPKNGPIEVVFPDN